MIFKMNKKLLLLAFATAAMTAAGMAAAKNSRKVKKMAKKVGRGAQQAVLDLDKAIGRYYR